VWELERDVFWDRGVVGEWESEWELERDAF